MNRLIPSEMRATVMSIRSFIIRMLFASLTPFLGYFAGVYSLRETFLFAGILFLVIGGVSLLFVLKSAKYPQRS